MTEENFKSTIKEIGKAMGIVGVIGGVAGLTIAAFSGSFTVGAVLAELSFDAAIATTGVLINRFSEKADYAWQKVKNLISRDNQTKKEGVQRRWSDVISTITLVSAPFEFVVGFAITGFSRPLADAAVIVTALPCTVIGIGGSIYNRFKAKKQQTEADSLKPDANAIAQVNSDALRQEEISGLLRRTRTTLRKITA